MAFVEMAYAKINLALHVRNRRADGYHDIETLFAFVDQGDVLTARPAEEDIVRTAGPFAHQIADPFANIVAKVLNVLPRPNGLQVDIEKNLPVAAGLGGGSADAGALFRIIRELNGLPNDALRRAATLGADVPACIESACCIGRGTGTELEPVVNDLAGTACLLVNPGVPLATGDVFAAWNEQDHGPIPDGAVSNITQHGRNDLEHPAIALCPAIGDVLHSLSEMGAFIARMSGSGATCYALFRQHDVMAEATRKLAGDHPGWWQMSGSLR
ncbi:MAG: 4-(cytidine 5'-diphospho)-2-C-methyl-D-erythritol kinase [Pontixanthobacter sp.]